MKTLRTTFSLLSKDRYLRNDEKYQIVAVNKSDNIFSTPTEKNVSLSEIMEGDYSILQYESGIEYKGIPTGQSYLDEDGDITDYQTVTLEDHPGRLKYSITNQNILISSLRLAKSPALMFEDLDLTEYVFSNGFYVFKVKDGWEPKFVLYVLRSKRIKDLLDNNLYRGIGISAYRVEDLLRCEIKKVSLATQKETIKKIEPLEIQIKQLKTSSKKAEETIDKVFQNEFSFDYDSFNSLKSIKIFTCQQSAFSNNPDLRFSAKFHRNAGSFVMKQLTDITDKKIKHYLAEPIVLGASISPDDFDENGKAYYVSMATIKTLDIVLDETQLVSDSYYRKNNNKSLKINDIIIARSGVAIGKTAIVKEDFDGIFADFTMRIRLDSNKYNPEFAYYYFRSTYFQYLIEIYKKGLQNQNIFPSVIQEFPMIDISLDEQQRIVDEIHSEIAKQEEIKSKIADLRNQIDCIIEEAITKGDE